MNNDLATLQALVGANDPDTIKKALTVSTGYVGINLEPTAKLMLPLYAGLRNRLPVDRPKMGGQYAQWRMQLGYGAFDFAGAQGTAFGGVGSDATGTPISVSAAYKSQAIKGSVQFEAIPMAQGWDDPLAIETSRSLATLIRLEELLTLGGNTAALTAPTVTATASTPHVTPVFASGSYNIQVTALTLQGAIANASGNSNVGESNVPTNVSFYSGASGCDWIVLSWTPVEGAVGYKVYMAAVAGGGVNYLVDPATQMHYYKTLAVDGAAPTVASGQTFITVSKVSIFALPAATAANAAPATDQSANANAAEGLIAWAEKSTIYSQSVGAHIKYNSAGANLTTSGSGVSEFDYILQTLWSQQQLSPSLIVCSPQSASHLTTQVLAANSSAMYRIELSPERGQFIGGAYIGGYLNKFAASMLGNQAANIPVWAHPYMTDGTYLFLTERIPYQYSREARGFALDVQTPYTYFELARTDRSFPVSTFYTECLKCYHPLANASIAGVKVE